MQRRKLIIYLIFAITVAYGIYFHFLANRDAGTNGDIESRREPRSMTTGDRAGRQAALSPDTTQRKTRVPDWNINPFSHDRRTKDATSRNIPSKDDLPDEPKVSAISRTSGQVLVTADGRVLRIGEKTGPWRLVDVGDNVALFDGPGGKIWIGPDGSR